MRRSDSLPPCRRASLCFAWRYHALRLSVRSRQPRTHDCGPGVGIRYPRPDLIAWRGPGRPKFLEDPGVPTPCSSTPAGPDTPCLVGVPMLPPCCQKRRLRRVVLSRLNGTALALAVYASSGGLPAPGRKTRFRLLARLYRVGLVTHRVPTKGFKGVVVTSSPPLPSFAWRNDALPNAFWDRRFGCNWGQGKLPSLHPTPRRAAQACNDLSTKGARA
jgi:hypothetical protein